MLEIKLERAMAPDQMEETPCGVCGLKFRPDAVVAWSADDSHCLPICEPCLKHLAARADVEPIPADWNDVYRRYVEAVSEYPEPVFPSVEALMEEMRQPIGYGLAAPKL